MTSATDNWKTELVSHCKTMTLLEEFLCEYQNILLSRGIDASEAVCKQNELIDEYAERIKQAMVATLENEINGDTSDGYHTFNELYHHRAILFSVIVRDHQNIAWKARKHHDGTMYDGMFIVGIETPKGQATYHYDINPYWEIFDCEEREFAPEWDGHTPDDTIARIAELGSETCENVKLHKQIDELINAINELQKKQPYCYNPDKPIDTLNTIGCYIDELEQLVHNMYNVATRGAEAETTSAWNTRTIKICEVEESFTEPMTLDYMQEYRCHRCGEYSYMQILYSEDKINYCSHCGAKVIY